MSRFSLMMVMAACLLSATPAIGQHRRPAYLILGPPASRHPHGRRTASRSGYPIRVPVKRYAYGWFGAGPRVHWDRHFGYYRSYTQWSSR